MIGPDQRDGEQKAAGAMRRIRDEVLRVGIGLQVSAPTRHGDCPDLVFGPSDRSGLAAIYARESV